MLNEVSVSYGFLLSFFVVVRLCEIDVIKYFFVEMNLLQCVVLYELVLGDKFIEKEIEIVGIFVVDFFIYIGC